MLFVYRWWTGMSSIDTLFLLVWQISFNWQLDEKKGKAFLKKIFPTYWFGLHSAATEQSRVHLTRSPHVIKAARYMWLSSRSPLLLLIFIIVYVYSFIYFDMGCVDSIDRPTHATDFRPDQTKNENSFQKSYWKSVQYFWIHVQLDTSTLALLKPKSIKIIGK